MISVIVALIVCWGIYSPMAEFLISPKFLISPITFAGVFLMNVVLGAIVSYLPFVEWLLLLLFYINYINDLAIRK